MSGMVLAHLRAVTRRFTRRVLPRLCEPMRVNWRGVSVPPFLFGDGTAPAHEPLQHAAELIFAATLDPSARHGLCIVGNQGTGTSTVLAAAVQVARQLPGIGRVVQVTGGAMEAGLAACDVQLAMVADAIACGGRATKSHDTVAVFIDEAHLLHDESWDRVWRLLRPRPEERSSERFEERSSERFEGRSDERTGTVRHGPPSVVVVAAGQPTTLMQARSDMSARMTRCWLEPLRTPAQYRAARRHFRQALTPGTPSALSAPGELRAPSALSEPGAPRAKRGPRAGTRAAIESWHLHTGGNWDRICYELSVDQVVAGRGIPAAGTAHLSVPEAHADAAQVCLQFLRRKACAVQWAFEPSTGEPGFCPFTAGSVVASAQDLGAALSAAGVTAVDFHLAALCKRGVLRLALDPGPPLHNNYYTFGTPLQGMANYDRAAQMPVFRSVKGSQTT
jgi:hypothetical protein